MSILSFFHFPYSPDGYYLRCIHSHIHQPSNYHDNAHAQNYCFRLAQTKCVQSWPSSTRMRYYAQTRTYAQKPSEDAVKKAQETAAEYAKKGQEYAKKGQEFATNLLKNSGGAGEYAKKGSEAAAKYAQSARSAVGPLADRGFGTCITFLQLQGVVLAEGLSSARIRSICAGNSPPVFCAAIHDSVADLIPQLLFHPSSPRFSPRVPLHASSTAPKDLPLH